MTRIPSKMVNIFTLPSDDTTGLIGKVFSSDLERVERCCSSIEEKCFLAVATRVPNNFRTPCLCESNNNAIPCSANSAIKLERVPGAADSENDNSASYNSTAWVNSSCAANFSAIVFCSDRGKNNKSGSVIKI